ncbi:GGDEF domain-containing protein [Desulfurivibrio dismutans]|uniref:GGDEF domain-containing protein n=1 Tax=Desulfurivibrio dismutans TaxID=1398908 RepID=UPI0023DBF68F|nr:GGDEF domain-containing protein [Desulfurivibrio alkaliphilus]MDF1614499.1 GGDEF domain-containing protein [Desulfurivibrio alkaliphilus]
MSMSRLLMVGSPGFLAPQARTLLEAKGYQLKVCERLQDAVGLVLEDPPDLLVVEKGFAGDGDRRLIKAVSGCLQKGNIPILLVLELEELEAELDWDVYPVDDIITLPLIPSLMLARLQLAEARMLRVFDNNPLSRLPGNTSILRAIRRVLAEGGDYAVCYVDIDNFKPYNDRYGFSRGDEVILMVARIIVNVIEEKAREGSFIGHVGGDDYVFIVTAEKAEEVCRQIIDNFNMVRNLFLNAEDIAAGAFIGRDRRDQETRFPLLSISIAVVTTGNGRYRHSGEVAVAASQLKHYVKRLAGSNYLIERRDSCVSGQ